MKNIILGILIGVGLLGAGVVSARVGYNTRLFKIFAERITVIEGSSGQFEVYKFVDGDNVCYLSANTTYQNGAPALECLKVK